MAFEQPYRFRAEREILLYFGDKTLRTSPSGDGGVDGAGGKGKHARWIVDLKGDDVVHLKSKSTGKYLRMHGDAGMKLDAGGGGGRFCAFKATQHEGAIYRLESVSFPGHFVAVRDGEAKMGKGGRFCHIAAKRDDATAPAISRETDFSRAFKWKISRVIVLQHAGDASLRVGDDDEVRADGGKGHKAQFHVELEGDTAKLRSDATGKYLRIKGDGKKVDCGGGGGKMCVFKVYPSEGHAAKLESTKWPGKFLAVKDGVVKVGGGGKWCLFHGLK